MDVVEGEEELVLEGNTELLVGLDATGRELVMICEQKQNNTGSMCILL